jgi:hypothetical protein
MGQEVSVEDSDMLVWSMIVRAAYGGMGGDIQMLHGFAALWSTRFDSNEILKDVASIGSSGDDTATTWKQIPHVIHSSASQQSLSRVNILTQHGVPCLTMNDISVEGVDFHCSAIIENILSDRSILEQCLDKLIATRDVPEGFTERRSWLEGKLKSWIWNHSAGVNRRRPLRQMKDSDDDTPAADDLTKSIWNELLQPRVKGFQEGYIRNRLAR